ncbi:uncharacterized protein [Gossypium hirsutum]|uniref:Uncharacterized protein n=1 Tax=Gossypium hirsutum TaxID=3635 RepID=A0ABM2Z9T1_GOSHI|nr:uncharacterized protein LOC121210913 [Gossypium hirsutum]
MFATIHKKKRKKLGLSLNPPPTNNLSKVCSSAFPFDSHESQSRLPRVERFVSLAYSPKSPLSFNHGETSVDSKASNAGTEQGACTGVVLALGMGVRGLLTWRHERRLGCTVAEGCGASAARTRVW